MNRPIRHGKGVKEILGKSKKFLKHHKVINRTLDHFGGDYSGKNQGMMMLKPFSALAKSYGYGKKRRVRGRGARPRTTTTRISQRRGKGKFWDWIKNKALPWLKQHKVISTVGNTLGAAGLPLAGTIGKLAGGLGYGLKRRTRRRRGRGPNQQVGGGYGGTNAFSTGRVGAGKKRRTTPSNRVSFKSDI